MGAWGPGLYQNDIAEDVKYVFIDQLRRGKKADEITRNLIEGYQNELGDRDDSFDFWCALADTQWNQGRLLPHVKEKALECLDRCDHMERWESAGAKALKKRQQVIEALRTKLESPQPPEKKISQYKLYRCPWKIGDTFALPMEGEYAQEQGFDGQYLLIRKVGERSWHPGHIIPVVHLKITQNKKIPENQEEYEHLEYVQTRALTYLSGQLDREQHLQGHKELSNDFILKTDEYGYLPIYRYSLITTSKRVIPSNLFYIGNYPKITVPKNEFVPFDELTIPAAAWKNLCVGVIQRYCAHNKRQLKIYLSTPQNHNE